MAEVKMSLNEYNEIVNDLRNCRMILKKLFAGIPIDEYQIESIEKYGGTQVSTDELSRLDVEFIKKFILDNLDPSIKDFLADHPEYGFEVTYPDYYRSREVGRISKIKVENVSDREPDFPSDNTYVAEVKTEES